MCVRICVCVKQIVYLRRSATEKATVRAARAQMPLVQRVCVYTCVYVCVRVKQTNCVPVAFRESNRKSNSESSSESSEGDGMFCRFKI